MRDYIANSYDEEFIAKINEQYQLTFPPLMKLYNDFKSEGVIREGITFNKFIEFLDMITKIDPFFYRDEDSLNLLLEGFIKFFS